MARSKIALGETMRYGYTPGAMNRDRVERPFYDRETTRESTGLEPADLELTSARFERLAARLHEGLPGHLGIELVDLQPGQIIMQMQIQPIHTAANGYLHAGSVVALADTACGFGCIANLPAGAENFTTVELKSNFLSTTLEGVIMAHAALRHGGKRTQIWDAEVRTWGEERVLALFRCTQMILYP
jgi:1,4-dihydroxy-2-naphthoyl-CoA hydrolase